MGVFQKNTFFYRKKKLRKKITLQGGVVVGGNTAGGCSSGGTTAGGCSSGGGYCRGGVGGEKKVPEKISKKNFFGPNRLINSICA